MAELALGQNFLEKKYNAPLRIVKLGVIDAPNRVHQRCLLTSLRNPIFRLIQLVGQDEKPSAGMVKLVDTPDLGSGAARRGSSSLSTRTKFKLAG